MPEENEGQPIPKPEITIFPEELPTTPEIAKQGAEDFKKFVQSIPDEELRDTVLADPHITGLFAGVNPEYGLSGSFFQFLSDEEIKTLKDVVENIGGNDYLLLIRKKEDNRKVSLFNLKAVEKVMNNHKNIFPFAGSPKDILKNRFYQWRDNWNHIRTGLLSGYPIEDVRFFDVYQDISFTLGENLVDDDLEFLDEYKNKDGKTQDDKVRMAGLVYKNFEHIEGDQIEHFLNQEGYMYKPLEGFVGFHKEKDIAWVQALNKIYDQSEIEDVVKSLQNEGGNR